MMVAVKYMAQLRRAAGTAHEEIELPSSCSLQDFFLLLVKRHGEPLRKLLLAEGGSAHPSVLVFVGDLQVTTAGLHALGDGDVITLLSPMAGG